jgi:hypothetical protein
LLFLPAFSLELPPAEHLWLLTNTALANQHITSIEDMEDPQAARCVMLQGQPELIRSATCSPGGHDASCAGVDRAGSLDDQPLMFSPHSGSNGGSPG